MVAYESEFWHELGVKPDDHVELTLDQAKSLLDYLDFVYQNFCPKGFFASKPERFGVEFKLLNDTTELKHLINKKYFDATVPESERSYINAKCNGELKFG